MAGKKKVSWSIDRKVVDELVRLQAIDQGSVSALAEQLLRQGLEMEEKDLGRQVENLESRMERLEEVARVYE